MTDSYLLKSRAPPATTKTQMNPQLAVNPTENSFNPAGWDELR
jgi:hypothetical protein